VIAGDWSHFDQDGRPGNDGLRCVQGSVSLIDQDPEDGCFQCWPGSHKVHSEVMRLNGVGATGNYYELGDDDKALLVHRGCNAYRIEVRQRPRGTLEGRACRTVSWDDHVVGVTVGLCVCQVGAGDMVLWRSDCAHSNAQPVFGRRKHRHRFRAVSYVCMLPASLTKEAAMKKKAEGWRLRKTTSHWPNLETWFRERPQERKRVAAFTQPPPVEQAQGRAPGPSPTCIPPLAPPLAPPLPPPPVLATQKQLLLHGLERYPASR
jgi:hypothetical protein